MVREFPAPTKLIAQALEALEQSVSTNPAVRRRIGPSGELPRPWDPATCTGSLRVDVWRWLDEVIEWINHEHVCEPVQVIPPCWPQHPAIVREVAVVAVLRVYAGRAPLPDRLEEWHRVTLPSMLVRLFEPGAAACEPGRHRDNPAAVRLRDYASEDARQDRARLFLADVDDEPRPPVDDVDDAADRACPTCPHRRPVNGERRHRKVRP
jgi:hypothetical protein